jgi:hypothetical protein
LAQIGTDVVEIRVVDVDTTSKTTMQNSINTALTNNPGYGLLDIPLFPASWGTGVILGRRA